jgi:hypothetical protein
MEGVAVLLHGEDTPLRGDPVFVRSANSATPSIYLHPVVPSALALLNGFGLASHRLGITLPLHRLGFRFASLGYHARFASLGVMARFASLGYHARFASRGLLLCIAGGYGSLCVAWGLEWCGGE